MIKRKVLVCCGTGIATSVQVARKLRGMLAERGIEAETRECKAIELAATIQGWRPDAVVATSAVAAPSPDITIYKGVPFLTGVGAAAAADEIAAALKGA